MSYTKTLDLEAQSSLATPVAVYTRKSSTEYRHKLTTNTSDPIDDFFGMTRESRHDRHPPADALPAYVADNTALPRYSAAAPEPVTLAMYLFKFGFFFPPFWILGVFILFSPLRELTPSPSPFSESSLHSTPLSAPSTSRWMPEKSELERHVLILELRRIEVKWAKRCLAAISILACVATGTGVVVWWVLTKSPAA